MFCGDDRIRNNIFVDIPWQQTTGEMLLSARNAELVCTSTLVQTVLNQTPTMPFQTNKTETFCPFVNLP